MTIRALRIGDSRSGPDTGHEFLAVSPSFAQQ